VVRGERVSVTHDDNLVQVAVLGAAYDEIADSICSATTICRRRDEWVAAGIFTPVEQIRLAFCRSSLRC